MLLNGLWHNAYIGNFKTLKNYINLYRSLIGWNEVPAIIFSSLKNRLWPQLCEHGRGGKQRQAKVMDSREQSVTKSKVRKCGRSDEEKPAVGQTEPQALALQGEKEAIPLEDASGQRHQASNHPEPAWLEDRGRPPCFHPWRSSCTSFNWISKCLFPGARN